VRWCLPVPNFPSWRIALGGSRQESQEALVLPDQLGRDEPPRSLSLRLPDDTSGLEVVLSLVRNLQRELDAVVTDVDVDGDGGTIVLLCRDVNR
jgi:hypothetical protein